VPGAQTEDASFAESIGDDDPHFELVDLGLTVASALRELSARDRRMLHMRFVEELTQTQIAARIGVSQMQVSRLLRRSLEQLRELSEARGDEHAPMAPTTLLAPQSDSTTEALSVKAA
jgi:RNA polymerase sigma-B factor